MTLFKSLQFHDDNIVEQKNEENLNFMVTSRQFEIVQLSRTRMLKASKARI